MHPRTDFADELITPPAPARELGYRMPAEWEPLARVWLTPPFNEETWPGCLDRAQVQFAELMAALGQVVEVATTQACGIPTNDSWIRDYGPIFVVRKEDDARGSDAVTKGPSEEVKETGAQRQSAISPSSLRHSVTPSLSNKAIHDFRFNGWGGKYEVRDLDDAVPQHVARRLGLPIWIHDLVLEGGSIDVNGAGTVMTTEQCLLNPNRNPHLSRERIVQELHDALSTRHVIWLPGGIVGDDTDGHIDDIARFVNPTTVVGIKAPPAHPDAQTLDRNWAALQHARDQDGRGLEVIELPHPDPIVYRFPPDRFGPGGENPVPASYANFLIANGSVFVPIFGQRTDDAALRTLERAMPGFRVVGLRADALVVGLGAFHCLSQQEPA